MDSLPERIEAAEEVYREMRLEAASRDCSHIHAARFIAGERDQIARDAYAAALRAKEQLND